MVSPLQSLLEARTTLLRLIWRPSPPPEAVLATVDSSERRFQLHPSIEDAARSPLPELLLPALRPTTSCYPSTDDVVAIPAWSAAGLWPIVLDGNEPTLLWGAAPSPPAFFLFSDGLVGARRMLFAIWQTNICVAKDQVLLTKALGDLSAHFDAAFENALSGHGCELVPQGPLRTMPFTNFGNDVDASDARRA